MPTARLRPIEHPTRIEVEQERWIRGIATVVWQSVPDVLAVYERELSRTDRVDDVRPVLNALLTMGARLRQRYQDQAIQGRVEAVARQVDGRHRSRFYAQLRSQLGVEVVASEGFRGPMLNAWIREHTAKIKSIRSDVIPSMAREIERAFAAGTRPEALAARWRRRGLPLNFGTVEGRSKVIARDQIGTLNGRLTQARQLEVGATESVWHTSGDERVRDEHEALNGRRFPTAEGVPGEGFPGEPVQCRCTASAVVSLETIAAQDGVEIKAANALAPDPLAAASLL